MTSTNHSRKYPSESLHHRELRDLFWVRSLFRPSCVMNRTEWRYSLSHEEAFLPNWIVIQRTEYFVPAPFVERTSLKAECIQVRAMTSSLSSLVLGRGNESRSVSFPTHAGV